MACWAPACEFAGSEACLGLCSSCFAACGAPQRLRDAAAAAPGPAIIVHPYSRVGVPLRSNLSLRVGALAGPDARYQWLKDGLAVPRATRPVLVLRSVREEDAGAYAVEVRTADGVATSNAAGVRLSEAAEAALQRKAAARGALAEALQQGDWQGALLAAEAALLADPLDDEHCAAVLVGRGRALARLRRLREALQAFGAATDLAPSSLEAAVGRARAARSAGKFALSVEAFEAAMGLAAGVSARAEIEAELEEVRAMLAELRRAAAEAQAQAQAQDRDRPETGRAGEEPPPPGERESEEEGWRSYRKRWTAPEDFAAEEEARRQRSRESWERFRQQRENFRAEQQRRHQQAGGGGARGAAGSEGGGGGGGGAGGERARLLRVLELPPDASQADVKRAYRRLALKCHPDKVDRNAAEEEVAAATARFQEVSAAADALLYGQ